MTPKKSSVSWAWPIWAGCLGCFFAVTVIAIEHFFGLLEIPAELVTVGAIGLASLCSISCLLWFYVAVQRPIQRHERNAASILEDTSAPQRPVRRGLGCVLQGATQVMRAQIIDVSDADLAEGAHRVRLRFQGDAADRLEALASSVEASDTWLRNRQATLTTLHTQLAQQVVDAAQDVKGLAQEQRGQQAQIQAFMGQANQALNSLHKQIATWSSVDPKETTAAQKRLELNAEALTDATAALLNTADMTQSAADQLRLAARQADDASQEVSTVALESTQAISALTAHMERAGEKVDASAVHLEGLVSTGRAAVVRTLKGVMDGTADLQTARRDLTAQSTAFGTHAQMLTDMREEMQEFLKDARQDVGDAARGIGAAASAAIERSTLDLARTCKAQTDVIAREVSALGQAGEVLADARQAAAIFTEHMPGLKDQAGKALAAFEGQLAAHHDLLEPLNARSSSIQAKMDTFSAFDGAEAASTLKQLKRLTQHISALKGPQEMPQIDALLQRFEHLEAGVLDHMKGVQDATLETAARTQDGFAQIQEAVTAHREIAPATLNAIKEMLDTAIDSAGLVGLSALVSQSEQGVTAQVEGALADMAAEQADARKALKAQLRSLSQRLLERNDGIVLQLKHMRSGHLQSLKQSIRALPDAVSGQVASALSSDVKALHKQLELAITDALAAPDLERLPQASDSHELQTPDFDMAAADLGERLQRALCAMDQIEEEVTALAAAALAAPQNAAHNEAFTETLGRADQVLEDWGSKLENVATAIALARDAA